MRKNHKYAYIIPIHKNDKTIERALDSVVGLESTIVYVACNVATKKWINENVEISDLLTVKFVTGKAKETSYSQLVNLGIKSIGNTAEFISILEFDDKVSPGAHAAMEPYFVDNPEFHIYTPLAAMLAGEDEEKLQMISMLNEASFAAGVFEEYGVYDINTMLKSNFIFVNGLYFRPVAFEMSGLFKSNIKLFEDYEFVLRALNNGCTFMAIPKVARHHYYTMDGEFERRKNLSQETRDEWLVKIKQEYFFVEDREID